MKKEINCLYCEKRKKLHDLMIEITPLNCSTLYLYKEQTYTGRCVVALNEHKREMYELNKEELASFSRDIARVAYAIKAAFCPDKINYAAFGDMVTHMHFHLVPKYEDGPKWGEAFEISPKEKILLSEAEYAEMIDKIKKYL